MNVNFHFLLSAFFLLETFVFPTGLQSQTAVKVGEVAPAFELMDISGKEISMNSYADAKGFIIIFTCNHCPFSVLYEDRINALHEKYASMGWPVIAINPNDPVQFPEDSFNAMKKRAKKKEFKFRYLFDESQETARAYGAERTPHAFVVKNDAARTVEYIGAIDDNPKSAGEVQIPYLENALNALDSGKAADPNFTKAIGCSIKWKSN